MHRAYGAFHSTRHIAGSGVRKAVDALFPERCVGCGAFGISFCGDCEHGLKSSPAVPRCPNCWAQWPGPDNCPRCFGWDALDGAVAAFDYEGSVRRAVRGLKYRHTKSLAAVMARNVAPLLARYEEALVLPIPLHGSRQRSRGFNQAELLLRIAGFHNPGAGLLRAKKTRAQYGLSLGERRTNVRGAFRYEGPKLQGKTVVVVDDVITTGATANECARMLKDAGARRVVAVAFARANYNHALPPDDPNPH